MQRLFGAYRNLQDTSMDAYNRYLNAQYKEKACCCGITPGVFTPAFQRFAHKLLGIESYEEWRQRIEEHNQFIIDCRLAEDAVIVSRPPSTEPPTATAVMSGWRIL